MNNEKYVQREYVRLIISLNMIYLSYYGDSAKNAEKSVKLFLNLDALLLKLILLYQAKVKRTPGFKR